MVSIHLRVGEVTGLFRFLFVRFELPCIPLVCFVAVCLLLIYSLLIYQKKKKKLSPPLQVNSPPCRGKSLSSKCSTTSENFFIAEDRQPPVLCLEGNLIMLKSPATHHGSFRKPLMTPAHSKNLLFTTSQLVHTIL